MVRAESVKQIRLRAEKRDRRREAEARKRENKAQPKVGEGAEYDRRGPKTERTSSRVNAPRKRPRGAGRETEEPSPVVASAPVYNNDDAVYFLLHNQSMPVPGLADAPLAPGGGIDLLIIQEGSAMAIGQGNIPRLVERFDKRDDPVMFRRGRVVDGLRYAIFEVTSAVGRHHFDLGEERVFTYIDLPRQDSVHFDYFDRSRGDFAERADRFVQRLYGKAAERLALSADETPFGELYVQAARASPCGAASVLVDTDSDLSLIWGVDETVMQLSTNGVVRGTGQFVHDELGPIYALLVQTSAVPGLAAKGRLQGRVVADSQQGFEDILADPLKLPSLLGYHLPEVEAKIMGW